MRAANLLKFYASLDAEKLLMFETDFDVCSRNEKMFTALSKSDFIRGNDGLLNNSRV